MHPKLKRFLKQTFLYIRAIFLQFLSLFTFPLRKKKWVRESVKNILVITQKRMGDSVVSIPAFRAIRQSLPQSQISLFATSYIRDILEGIEECDNIIEYEPNQSLFGKTKIIRKFSKSSYDLVIDLTCDYTLEGALLSFLSRAKFRVGYNTFGRGFLFHKSIPHENRSTPMSEEILEIVRSIGLDTKDKSLKIKVADSAQKEVRLFLGEHKITETDLLIGIHPGGYYKTQRWFPERFARLANELMKNDHIKIVFLGGPKEKSQMEIISQSIQYPSMIYTDKPVRNMIALIHSCHLLICNNSGPLHLATALGTPTVSFMGPTLPERWWPQGEGHTVLRKDISCMPCNDGICERKTIECLKLITVDDVMKAVDIQLSKLK